MKTETPDDGGYAFPVIISSDTDIGASETGMPMRDWFAGQALAGKCGYGAEEVIQNVDLAKEAYTIADLMLIERAKLKETP